MRTDEILMLDMLVAAHKLQRFVAEMTWAEFEDDELVQSAAIRELQVIGEAARRVTDATRALCPDIEWPVIVAFRNRLVHEYFSIRLEVVWDIIQDDIPLLIARLEQYIPPDHELSE